MQPANLIRRAIDQFKKGRCKHVEDKLALRQLYFITALQYHICARYAAFAGFIPACGSLFHHAIEMYLKGYLCDSMDEEQRKRLGHNLNKIWRKFKATLPDPDWSRFDSLISSLDRYEDIRYPERVAKEGMIGYIHFSKPAVAKKPSSRKRSEPHYEVVVDEIDALSKMIFAKRMNPKAFISGLNSYAQNFLKQDNKSPM